MLIRSPRDDVVAVLCQCADDGVYSPKDWWVRKDLYLSTTEFKELLILCETYISVTVEESKIQTTRLELLPGILFFLRPPGNGNDLGVIAPRFFPQNRSQKQSQVYFRFLLVPVSRHNFLSSQDVSYLLRNVQLDQRHCGLSPDPPYCSQVAHMAIDHDWDEYRKGS